VVQNLNLAIQVFYFFWAILGLSLLNVHLELYFSRKNTSEPKYFSSALIFFTLSPILFAISGYWPLVTIANTVYILCFIAFSLAIYGINKEVPNFIFGALIFFAVSYAGFFEYLRQLGSNYFVTRVAITVIPAIIFSAISLFGVYKINSTHSSRQLKVLQIVLCLLIVSLLWRLLYLMIYGSPGVGSIYQEKEIFLLWLRVIAGALLFLCHLTLHNHFFKSNWEVGNRTAEENVKFTELLKEKERLIYGLLKANKTAATGALSASIAHELNQPLGASSLNIQFLKMKLEKGLLNPQLGKEVLDSLEADNNRAATIVRSLKSIFTDTQIDAQEVQLGDSITKVLDIVRPELKSKNIQIQLKVDDDLKVFVNPSEIEQVILNLVNNAAQALANAGTLQRRIAIEAIKVDQSTNLIIADNGPGVPAVFKSQLFELLSTTKQTGMGLGLWLCSHIIARYGGSIHHEDVLGGGAKFVVRFPPPLAEIKVSRIG